jgi:hypothetical protein
MATVYRGMSGEKWKKIIFVVGFRDGEDAGARIRKLASANNMTGWPDDVQGGILQAAENGNSRLRRPLCKEHSG